MKFTYNDGGRSKYFSGKGVGDCVARAVAIASGRDYKDVYDFLAAGNANQRITKNTKRNAGAKTAANGIDVRRKWFKDYMLELGFEFESFSRIGKPSKLKLDSLFPDEGTFIASLGKHYTCVIDGVINDTFNCQMGRSYFDENGVLCEPKPRMVYGIWKRIGEPSYLAELEEHIAMVKRREHDRALLDWCMVYSEISK